MKYLIEFSLKQKGMVLLFILLVILSGIYFSVNLPVDAVPDITPIQVVVNARTGALDPEQIEKAVTYKIESEMSSLPHVEEIRSISKYGLAQVTIRFEEGTGIYQARAYVAEKLASLSRELPSHVTVDLGPVSTGLGEVLMYTVQFQENLAKEKFSSEKEKLLYLRTIQDYYIRPALKKIAGVAEIDSNGGYQKELQIFIKPQNLKLEGVSFAELRDALLNIGENFGGGIAEKGERQFIIRGSQENLTKDEIANFPIKMRFNGQFVRLKDLADIRWGGAFRQGAATWEGEEAVLGTVLMRMGANSREVALQCEKALKGLNLPEGVEVKIHYSRRFLVDETLKTVFKNLFEGALLVNAILLLLLGNLLTAFIVSLAIPLSMLIAVVGMHVAGISANLMSLGALDFGLLVDASVVLVEHAVKNYGLKKTKPSNLSQFIEENALEIIKPVSRGIFIIILVYLPILALEGIEGKLFRPMALTVIFALLGSLLVAFLFMPLFLFFLLRFRKLEHKDPILFRILYKSYVFLLEHALKKPKLFYTISATLFLGAFFIYFHLGFNFIPELDEYDRVVMIARPTTISLKNAVEKQKKAEEIIKSFPEVETVFSRLGTAETATDPMGVHLADTFVIFNKKAIDPKKRDKIIQDIFAKLEELEPASEISLTQPVAMRFNEMLEGSRSDISLRLKGSDLKKLMELTEKSIKILEEIPGVESLEMDPLTALKEGDILSIKPKPEKLAYYGTNLMAINETILGFLAGFPVGFLSDEGYRFPIKIYLDENLRAETQILQELPVMLPDGGFVKLKDVSSFSMKTEVTTIARHFGRRYSNIAIYLKNRDLSSFVQEANLAIKQKLELPQGYSIEWEGQFKHMEKAKRTLSYMIPLILAFIFLIIYQIFQSFRTAILVFLAVPFASTGGVYFLFLSKISLSVSAAIGFIALSGIAILNSLVLVNLLETLVAQKMPIKQAIVYACQERFRPVLMTALVAALGFLPMTMAKGLGAEVQRPLATVVVGGLFSATLLTLLLLPLLYLKFRKTK